MTNSMKISLESTREVHYGVVVFPAQAGDPVGPVSLTDETGKIRMCAEKSDSEWVGRIDYLPARQAATLSPEDRACEGQVSLEENDGFVRVLVSGQLFTQYQFASDFAKPFLGPVYGPYGDEITRALDPSIKEHPHHRGIFLAHGDVNGEEIWNEPEGKHGRCVHRKMLTLKSGPVCGEIATLNDWVSRDGKPLLQDVRRFKFYSTPESCRVIDVDLLLKASFGPVDLGATKEAGFLGIRMHPDVTVDARLGGRIENANGGVGESECWSRPSPWVDYSGWVQGNRVGISALDHPENPRAPSKWHVRDYGLFAANPWYWDGPMRIETDQTLRFRYRILIHAGDAQAARVQDHYLLYAWGVGVKR